MAVSDIHDEGANLSRLKGNLDRIPNIENPYTTALLKAKSFPHILGVFALLQYSWYCARAFSSWHANSNRPDSLVDVS